MIAHTRSAGVLMLVAGAWYWYPCVIALFPRVARAPPVQPRPQTPTQVQPRMDVSDATSSTIRAPGWIDLFHSTVDSLCVSQERGASASFAALKDELYADLRERETKWFEDRDRDLQDVLVRKWIKRIQISAFIQRPCLLLVIFIHRILSCCRTRLLKSDRSVCA